MEMGSSYENEYIKTLQQMLEKLMSSNNNLRIQSELDFKHLMESNPDSFAYALIQVALDTTLNLAIRQASLLHLKRVVPLYWSPAFDKFQGPNTINQDVKATLRKYLLRLIADPDSKIRSGSGYAIVQIAAVDYPDEWPDLLTHLYNSTTNSNSSVFEIVGSLCVMQEIFDDVVTDELFFEGGVAIQVLNTCETLLQNNKHNLEVKVETLRLLKIICQAFENVDFEIPNREAFCNSTIPQVFQLLVNLLQAFLQNGSYFHQLIAWDFKHELYTIVNLLLNSNSELLEKFIPDLFSFVLDELSNQQKIYTELTSINPDIEAFKTTFIDLEHFNLLQRERREPMSILSITIAKEVEFVQTLIEINNLRNIDGASKLLDVLLQLSVLSASKIDEYNSDFNQFVTDESGLGVDITIRESVRIFLSDMNAYDNSIFTNLLIEKLGTYTNFNSNQAEIEAVVFLLGACFDNDDTIVETPKYNLQNFLEHALTIITNESLLNEEFQFLLSRFILMVPKFLFRYASICKEFGVPSFDKIVSIIPRLGGIEDFFIMKSSILISLQYYNYFIRAKEFGVDTQRKLVELVHQLKDDSDEDVNMMLLEVMTIIISMNNEILSQTPDAMQLVLTIGFKNALNFALNTSMFECIEDLITRIPQENYLNLISAIFPYLLSKISEFGGEYNSEIDLSLQVVTVFIKDQENYGISQDIFNSAFSVISKFLFVCDDDELLQSGSEALIELVKNSVQMCSTYVDNDTQESGVQILLKSVSKFLSPTMSDRAIVKLGDLVTLLLQNFGDSIHEYLEEILKALAIRLSKASEVPTIENMILIFNMLTIAQPFATIQFLKSFSIDNETALSKILPIWFQAYEVMRGYNSILSNVQAFIEIYKLNDDTVQHLIVNGDPLPHQIGEGIIVTRSMAKRMTIRYEQIPSDAKIVRLLIDELKNEVVSSNEKEASLLHSHDQRYAHSHHHDHEHEHEHEGQGNEVNNYIDNADDNDDDGWEDFEDMGEQTFDKLKSYVDEEGNVKRGSDGDNNDMKQLLISFFKECTSKNTSNFENIYNHYLSDTQKSLLSEYLVFT